jgi:hypothetical protein
MRQFVFVFQKENIFYLSLNYGPLLQQWKPLNVITVNVINYAKISKDRLDFLTVSQLKSLFG